MNFDKIWWKHSFHQISSNFIKVHQKNQGFEKRNELWWNLMKFGENMVFHQISSKFIKKIKVLKKNELWWNLMKTRFSSNFIKFHQSSSKLNSFEKNQQPVIETRFRFATPWKVEINVTNVCWTLVLLLHLYVLYVCLVSNINLFWFGKYWKTRVLLK